MKIKLLASALILIFATIITLPVFAATPQTPADCQRIYAGNDEAIQACINRLGQ